MKKAPNTEKLHCNLCRQPTNHRKVYEHNRSDHNPEDEGIRWGSKYELLICQGCEEVTLREKSWCSEDYSNDRTISYYPPRIALHEPEWLYRIEDNDILGLLRELYAALQADSRRLAMMGCRAILDRLIVLAIGDAGTFKEKLDDMVSHKLLSNPDRDVLRAAIDAGSASAHRGYQPSPQILQDVVSIVERSVQSTLLADVATAIEMSTPSRPKSTNRNSKP